MLPRLRGSRLCMVWRGGGRERQSCQHRDKPLGDHTSFAQTLMLPWTQRIDASVSNSWIVWSRIQCGLHSYPWSIRMRLSPHTGRSWTTHIPPHPRLPLPTTLRLPTRFRPAYLSLQTCPCPPSTFWHREPVIVWKVVPLYLWCRTSHP